MKLYIKTNSKNEIFQAMKVPFSNSIEIETDIAFDDIVGYSYIDGQVVHSLKSLKVEKLKDLETAHNASKKIIIKNGETLVIEHNTPERDIFINKLMTVSQESFVSNASLAYQQQVGNVMYRFSASPTVWSYIFKDLFFIDRKTSNGTPNGIKENYREHNQLTFNAVALTIQNSTTIVELNAVSWEFANPDGIIINVNEKATQMLNDESVDDFTKEAIRRVKDIETGEIHLINIVS